MGIARSGLAESLELLARAVPQRPTAPSHALILIEDSETGLRLTAGTSALQVQAELPGAHVGASCAVPGRALAQLVLRAIDAVIDLSVKGDHLTLRGDHLKSHLRASTPERFDKLTLTEGVVGSWIAAPDLQRALRSVVFAAATSDVRPALTGVHLASEQDRYVLTAANEARVSQYSLERNGQSDLGALVPTGALEIVAPALRNLSDPVLVGRRGPHFIVECQNFKLAALMLDLTYPDVSPLVHARTNDSQAAVRTLDLLRVVEQALVVAHAGSNLVRLRLSPGVLEVSASAADVGDVADSLDCQVSGPESATVLINGHYLAEALGRWPTDHLTVSLDPSGLGPAHFVAGTEYLYVAMAVRVTPVTP